MSLRLYFHPLSSFCHKVLIALYENETPFAPHLVNFGDEAANRAFLEMWPPRKIPVLRDETRDRMVPETSIIIEYLQQHYPGKTRLIPDEPDHLIKVTDGKSVFIIEAERVAWVRIGLKTVN